MNQHPVSRRFNNHAKGGAATNANHFLKKQHRSDVKNSYTLGWYFENPWLPCWKKKTVYVTCAGKISHNEQIFKNELFLFSFKMMYELLELDKKWYTIFEVDRVSKLNLEKSQVKVFWRFQSKITSNVAYFPPILFLIIITILIITIYWSYFLFYLCCYKEEQMQKRTNVRKKQM